MRLSDIRKQLTKNGYLPNDEIVMAAYGALHGVPLLVESDPGQGKTSLALAMGQAFGLSVLRVQFYEGLTADKILYDYNYQRQLLSIQAIQSTLAKNLDGKTINEAMDVAKTIDFYGKDFLIRRPVLESIWGEQRYVLLFDEVDKASEELEYTLLEFLDDFSLSIPQYGTDSIDKAVQSVLQVVPAKGVYSDYNRPLEMLWEKNRKYLKKDSFILFLGDYRNNKNPSGTEWMKNIHARAKKMFFLNTEQAAKWNQGDSIASVYAAFAPMYEIQTPADLIRFISQIR